MISPDRYSLPTPLLQAVVSALNELPARQVRALLNDIEAECVQQDQAAQKGAATVQTSARPRKAREGAST